MGIRMFEARDVITDAKVSAEAAIPGRTYLCEHCKVALTFVRVQVVRGDDGNVRRTIPPFYRLRPNKDHRDGCLNSPSGYLSALRARARAVEDGPDPFEAAAVENAYRFRLNIPYLIARASASSTKENIGRIMAASWSTGVLDNYCRSALGLAKLWHGIESSKIKSELQRTVQIASEGQTIVWDDFAYDFDGYGRLVNHLRSGREEHATVLAVVPKNFRDAVNDRVCVQCEQEPVAAEPNDVRVSPKIWIPSNLRGHLQEGRQYLVFGYWKFKEETHWEKHGLSILFQNIEVNVNRPAQIARLKVPAGGQ